MAEVRRSLERDIDRLEDEVDRLEREGNNATGELYELVEEQREMIGELVEVVEVLTLVADGTELKNASAAHENGAEVPIDWRGPAHEFVSAQYR